MVPGSETSEPGTAGGKASFDRDVFIRASKRPHPGTPVVGVKETTFLSGGPPSWLAPEWILAVSENERPTAPCPRLDCALRFHMPGGEGFLLLLLLHRRSDGA